MNGSVRAETFWMVFSRVINHIMHMAELSKKQITRLKAWRTEFERMLEADDNIKKLDTEAGFSTQQRMDAETALRSIDQMLANAIGDGTPAIDVRKKEKS